MSETSISEYKGKPIFNIEIGEYKGEKKFFSFGVKKAQLILDNLDAIRAFVDNPDPKASSGSRRSQAPPPNDREDVPF